MARGVSTVLDVALCLLLVGVAVATLTTGGPELVDEPVDADPSAAQLSTTTTSVTVDDRTVHGTHAEQLALATLLAATLDGEPLAESPYPDAVVAETDAIVDERVSVVARWEPTPNGSLGGELTAGTPTPRDATVAATTLSVRLLPERSPEDFEAAATAIATETIERLFPPDRTRAALVDPRTAEPVAERYRVAAAALDVDVDRQLRDGDVRALNGKLASALATEIEPSLRAAFDAPDEAVTTARDVELVVRRWQP